MSERPPRYGPIALSDESTVVAEFIPESQVREKAHQGEADLERDFIERLQAQGYEYLSIKNEEDLIANLREQLEALNDIKFSDDEWALFSRRKSPGPISSYCSQV